MDDTFKSCGNEVGEVNNQDETEESLAIGPSDTMMTQGFIPSAERYTPTHEHESKFTPIEHPLREVTGRHTSHGKIWVFYFLLKVSGPMSQEFFETAVLNPEFVKLYFCVLRL